VKPTIEAQIGRDDQGWWATITTSVNAGTAMHPDIHTSAKTVRLKATSLQSATGEAAEKVRVLRAALTEEK